MSIANSWLDLGLDALPAERAQRVRLFRLLLVSAAQLRTALDRELAPTGITSQQGTLLQLVEAQAKPPTISDVARALDMTHQNLKQIALALQRKGFLEIVVDPLDRRARRLQLTPHHHRFWKHRNPSDFAAVESWTAGLSDDEIESAVNLLLKLRRRLGRPHLDGG